MPLEDLPKLRGKPPHVARYALLQETEWEWRWMQPPNTPMVFPAVLNDHQSVVRSGSSQNRSVEAP
ncbi:hypothetical protein NS331_21910, partial [Pseudacidovorax intermedius]